MSDHLFFQGLTKPGPVPRSPVRPVCRHSAASADGCAGSEEFFRELFALVGLPAGSYRQSFLHRRFSACLRFLSARDTGTALAKIHKHPELAKSVLSVVLLGVTEFYRDPHVFQHVREVTLPSWKASGITGPRIWSAACSDGQELYSVALLLAEAGLIEQSMLLGTDYRSEAITKARAGKFGLEGLARFDAALGSHLFEEECPGFQVREQLRCIHWKQADLFAGAESGPWDLILWRNMSIYLNRDASEVIWRNLVRELRPGGCLITGKADYPPAHLRLVRLAPCVYLKTEMSQRS